MLPKRVASKGIQDQIVGVDRHDQLASLRCWRVNLDGIRIAYGGTAVSR